MKEEFMSNMRKLKLPVDKFRGIGIANDLHPVERNEIKRMIGLQNRSTLLMEIVWTIIVF